MRHLSADVKYLDPGNHSLARCVRGVSRDAAAAGLTVYAQGSDNLSFLKYLYLVSHLCRRSESPPQPMAIREIWTLTDELPSAEVQGWTLFVPLPLGGPSRAAAGQNISMECCPTVVLLLCVWRGRCQLRRPTQAPACGTPRVVKRGSLLGRSVHCAQFPESPCKAEQGDYVHRARDALPIKRHAPLSQGLVSPPHPRTILHNKESLSTE